MSTTRNPRITVEIEGGADPIRGSIEHRDGRREAFWGWLELIEEVRHAAAEPPERAPPERAPPDRPRRAPGRGTGPTRQVTHGQPNPTTKEP